MESTAQPMAATRQSDDAWKWHNRYRNRHRNRYRYRDRFRHDRAAGINTEASDYAQFSIATAIAIPMPIPTPFFRGAEKSFSFWQGLLC